MTVSAVSPIAIPAAAPTPVAPQKPAAAAAAPQPVLTPAHSDTVSISSASQASSGGRDGDSDAS